MSITKKTHWLGPLLLFTASILLLIVTISAPIINHASLLHVTLPNATTHGYSALDFGTFGYCVSNIFTVDGSQKAYCTPRHIGYNPADILTATTHTTFATTSAGTANSLTRVMVLHPIACGLAFIAFLTTLGGRTIAASVSGSLVASLAWVLTLVSLALDFTAFGIVRHQVNRQASGLYPRAGFGSAIWCLVVGLVALSAGIVVLGGSFCGAWRERRAEKRGRGAREGAGAGAGGATGEGTSGGGVKRKKRFGIF